DILETRAVLLRSGTVGFGLGAAIVLLQVPIGWLALFAVGPSAEVQALAERYFEIRIWGAPAVLVNFAMLGWLIGIQRARDALVLQLTANGVNIALDLLLVIGFGFGVEGVAIA